MTDIAISVEHLSKMYLLYNRPVDRLKQSLFGPFGKNFARIFWALRDVSFSVEKGQAIGIIGRNGSGKSTLLQILAGTLALTEGEYQVNGRVAALLELGAGFNPDFTGRENIFLNGATLGIPEKEMRKMESAIIDFAQIGDFIDQPVKIYSSGMFVRLAFAIATCIEPEILIVDEALAVGDAGFVIKCMNRMREMRERGTTIVLVTHDVQTVRSFCDSVLWLHEGKIRGYGSPADITARYLQFLFEEQNSQIVVVNEQTLNTPSNSKTTINAGKKSLLLANRPDLTRWGSGEIQIQAFQLDNGLQTGSYLFEYGQQLKLTIQAKAAVDVSSPFIGFGFSFRNTKGLDIITFTTFEDNIHFQGLQAGQTITLNFETKNILAPGSYALVLNIEKRLNNKPQYLDFIENAILFTVVSEKHIFSLVLPDIDHDIQVL